MARAGPGKRQELRGSSRRAAQPNAWVTSCHPPRDLSKGWITSGQLGFEPALIWDASSRGSEGSVAPAPAEDQPGEQTLASRSLLGLGEGHHQPTLSAGSPPHRPSIGWGWGLGPGMVQVNAGGGEGVGL